MTSRDAVLEQLFNEGPVWDGDLVSKQGRNELYSSGFVDRLDGWNWLTRAGVAQTLLAGLGRKKELRRRAV